MKNIRIYLRRNNKSNFGYVWISFYINREKINFSTKVSVEKRNWSDKKGKVGVTDNLHVDKNLIIENILSRINNVFVKYRLKDKQLTKETFLRAYRRSNDYETIFDYITEHIKKQSARIEYTTLRTHQTAINKLKDYNSLLCFDDITHEWLDDFFCYLRKELGNNDNTAYKNMSILRKYVRAAFQDGFMDENPFKNWSIKKTTSSCIYLTEKELNSLLSIYKYGELAPNLHRTLEFFLFECFSSLHIGDAKALMLEQFTETSFTYFRMKLRNRKPEPIIIPLSEPLKIILKNIVGTRKKGKIFENITADQVMNRDLKEIAKIAEIDKRLTHKVGRHTFATIFLRKTKDLATLKSILGHSDLKETMVYAHVMDESKQEGITVFNSFEI